MSVIAPERVARITLKLHTLEKLKSTALDFHGDLNYEAIESASTPEELYDALCDARSKLELQRQDSEEGTPLRERQVNRFFYLTKFIHCNFDGIL